MGLGKLVNAIFGSLGRTLVSPNYKIPDWQRTPDDNFADNSYRDFRLKREGQILLRHESDLRQRGFSLYLYEIIVRDELQQIGYTQPGKSILLMHGVNPTTSIADENEQSLVVHSFESPFLRRSSGVTPMSGAQEEFLKSEDQLRICYELLRPYQLLPESEHQAYFEAIKSLLTSQTGGLKEVLEYARSFEDTRIPESRRIPRRIIF